MTYLLIALVILFVISPLLWMRQTPGQARITAFRNRALQLGLKVQMVPPADAPPGERSPDAVRYLRPVLTDDRGRVASLAAHWTLLRNGRRGRDSPFAGWRWQDDEAPAAVHGAIASCLAALPETAEALRADEQGLSVYWSETGTVHQVDALAGAIDELFSRLLVPTRPVPPPPHPLKRYHEPP